MDRTSEARFGRSNGSPPVNLTLSTPFFTNTRSVSLPSHNRSRRALSCGMRSPPPCLSIFVGKVIIVYCFVVGGILICNSRGGKF